jgi:hypothetical protein
MQHDRDGISIARFQRPVHGGEVSSRAERRVAAGENERTGADDVGEDGVELFENRAKEHFGSPAGRW